MKFNASEFFGKSVFVHSFCVELSDNSLVVKMSLTGENNKSYYGIFQKVYALKLSNVSYPFQICGFEIQDNILRGFDNASRYFVNDYEDGEQSFYCESFDIIEE